MTVLNIKVIHRLLLKGALDSYGKEGHMLSTINNMMKILNKINFTDDEIKELNLKVSDGNISWTTTKDNKPDGEPLDVEKMFELSSDEEKVLVELFKRMHDKKEFKVENFALVDVVKQLGEELTKYLGL